MSRNLGLSQTSFGQMLSKEQTWTGSNSHFALLDQSSAIWTKLAEEPLSYFLLVKFHFLLNTEIATLHCCCIHASPKDIGSLQYWTGLPLVHNLGANSMAAFSFFSYTNLDCEGESLKILMCHSSAFLSL